MFDLKTILVFPCQPTNATAIFNLFTFFVSEMGLYCNGDGPRENDVRPARRASRPGRPVHCRPGRRGGPGKSSSLRMSDAARRSDEDVPPPLPVRPSVLGFRFPIASAPPPCPFLASTRCFFPWRTQQPHDLPTPSLDFGKRPCPVVRAQQVLPTAAAAAALVLDCLARLSIILQPKPWRTKIKSGLSKSIIVEVKERNNGYIFRPMS